MNKARPFITSALITGIIMTTISFFIEDATQAKSTLIAGLIIAVTIATIPIYDIDKWSLAKRSVLHFLIMLVTVLPLLLLSGWFAPYIAIGVFLLFGIVGWTIGYTVNRLQNKKKIK